jgi:large subunit ribosomal protein L24
LRIKKGDMAVVITGKNKGASGRVLSIMPEKNRVIVEGVNMIKKHQKPNKKFQQGGIIEKEGPLNLSNTMLVCPKCSKPTRIGVAVLAEGKKLRSCKKCKEVIE